VIKESHKKTKRSTFCCTKPKKPKQPHHKPIKPMKTPLRTWTSTASTGNHPEYYEEDSSITTNLSSSENDGCCVNNAAFELSESSTFFIEFLSSLVGDEKRAPIQRFRYRLLAFRRQERKRANSESTTLAPRHGVLNDDNDSLVLFRRRVKKTDPTHISWPDKVRDCRAGDTVVVPLNDAGERRSRKTHTATETGEFRISSDIGVRGSKETSIFIVKLR
jgi:hypothetical protein